MIAVMKETHELTIHPFQVGKLDFHILYLISLYSLRATYICNSKYATKGMPMEPCL